MEKFFSPLINTENDGGITLVEENTPVVLDPADVVHEKLAVKSKVESKNIKTKKLRVKRCRGEKRKLPDRSDTVKIKRKKKEEKLQGGNSNPNENISETIKTEVMLIKTISMLESKDQKREASAAVENGSDAENSEKLVKQKFSRKSKAVASKCREAFNFLSNLDFNVLISMDKCLKILKSNNLLDNKLISVDVLLDLISLALETNKGSDVNCEKQLPLLSIISKCVNELNTPPRRLKAKQSLVGVFVSPLNSLQEEVPHSTPATKEDFSETPRIVDLEEAVEEIKVNGEQVEKSELPAVEKSGKNFCITNYFKKLKRTVEEKDKNERFCSFTAKTDMFLAPKLGGELTEERRKNFEDEFERQSCESSYLSKVKRRKKSLDEPRENKSNCDVEKGKEASPDAAEAKNCHSSECPEPDAIARKRAVLVGVDKPKAEPIDAVCRTKAKLFQFHDNRRPPYWGTWRKKSESVRPRRPFGKEKTFNYEIDSDDEWEEEEELGESLHGSEDEKEPEEDYEVDNDFFVPHGYLSDDENPEKEDLSRRTKLDLLEEQFTSERKQKTRKMTPIVFGTFWVHNGLTCEGTLYQDLQIDKLQYVPWTAVPVEIGEEDMCEESGEQGEPISQLKKYKPKKKPFPNEEIPNLIKMIHGSAQNSDLLAKKFLLYWKTEKFPIGKRPGLTKVCVQKKIKELAAWQASHEKGKMCWQVPKETREEFGAEVVIKTPEKKPRKCFIWKFVRKAEKNRGAEAPPAPASSVEPEVSVFES